MTLEKLTIVAAAQITSDGTQFWSQGFDKDENSYNIYWDILANWINSSDEAQEDATDACNWDCPSSIELV